MATIALYAVGGALVATGIALYFVEDSGDQTASVAISPLGEALWSFPTGGSASSAPAIGADGVIYFGSFDGFVYAVTGEGNELWNYDTGALWVESSAAIAADGKVYIGDQGGTLIAFGPGDE